MKICRCSRLDCITNGCLLTRPEEEQPPLPSFPVTEERVRQIVREEIERFKDDNK